MITRDSKIYIRMDYDEAQVNEAVPMGTEIPSWLEGANINKVDDNTFSLTYGGNVARGNVGESYWVKYGEMESGMPRVKIVDKSDPAFDAYYLCTEDGDMICSLRDFDDNYEHELDYNLRLTPEEYASQLEREELHTVRLPKQCVDELVADDGKTRYKVGIPVPKEVSDNGQLKVILNDDEVCKVKDSDGKTITGIRDVILDRPGYKAVSVKDGNSVKAYMSSDEILEAAQEKQKEIQMPRRDKFFEREDAADGIESMNDRAQELGA